MADATVWAHKGTFLLAAVGSAVGLGNLWRFPYLAGENGGGAFILVYAMTIAAVGLPILIAETLLGRASRKSPIMGMVSLIKENNSHRAWSIIGWLGAIAAFIILSFYSVIAGWAFHYVGLMFSGRLTGASVEQVGGSFNQLLAQPGLLIIYHSLFIAVSALIVGLGVHRGIEKGLRFIMPALFFILLLVLGYAIVEGDIGASLAFMFTFNLEDLSLAGWLEAMGQSFFTLSLGAGAIMAYGAYMSSEASLSKTAVWVAIVDTLVAVLAGIAIFALVFGSGLEAGQGPGLMFVTLPLAFAELPGGAMLGGIFFILVIGAAVTSAISLLEPFVAYLIDRFHMSRPTSVLMVTSATWCLGLLTVFSFNIWQADSFTHQLFGKSPFDILELLTNIMMPLGGALIALYVGWSLRAALIQKEMNTEPAWLGLWQFLIRFIAPTAVLFVFVRTLLPQLEGYTSPLIISLIIVLGFAYAQTKHSHSQSSMD
ncbi:MAG: sodium-dependent transporter [Oleiphilus sp.]